MISASWSPYGCVSLGSVSGISVTMRGKVEEPESKAAGSKCIRKTVAQEVFKKFLEVQMKKTPWISKLIFTNIMLLRRLIYVCERLRRWRHKVLPTAGCFLQNCIGTRAVPGAARSQELCLGLPCGLQRYQGAEMEQVFEQVFYGLPASQ